MLQQKTIQLILQKKNIVFEFNENVVPNNWSENFSISPLSKEPVNFKIKNKTLTLDLDNKLEKKHYL